MTAINEPTVLDPVVEERILRAASFEEGDRVPIWDYIDNRFALDHFAPGETDLLKANVKVYHGLGIDLCRGFGSSFSPEQEGQTHSDGVVESVISGQTQWERVHRVRTLDDLKTIDWEPAAPEAIREEWIRHYRSVQAAFAPHTMFVPGGGCGFHATYGLMGLQLFCYALADAPAEIERIMELHLADAVARAKVAAEAKLCPLYFIGDDIAYKGKLMFSPDYLRRSFIRCLRSCCEPLQAAGIKAIFHSDGNVMEILDDMLDAGIDGLHPLEPIAGMDIGYLKRRYGKRLVLVGGVDCSQVLPLGTVEEVIAAAKHVLRTGGPGGGLFIGSSSEITPSTPLENILAFYETARTAGQYPIRC